MSGRGQDLMWGRGPSLGVGVSVLSEGAARRTEPSFDDFPWRRPHPPSPGSFPYSLTWSWHCILSNHLLGGSAQREKLPPLLLTTHSPLHHPTDGGM